MLASQWIIRIMVNDQPVEDLADTAFQTERTVPTTPALQVFVFVRKRLFTGSSRFKRPSRQSQPVFTCDKPDNRSTQVETGSPVRP
jgi:hypothetical protein